MYPQSLFLCIIIDSCFLSYENHAEFDGRSTSSTGLQNQHTGYIENLAGGAPLSLIMEFNPLSPHRVQSFFFSFKKLILGRDSSVKISLQSWTIVSIVGSS